MGACCSCCPCCKKSDVYPERQITTRLPSAKYDAPVAPKSPSPKREQSPGSPFSKSGISKTNPLNLIHGFENEPLVSLEEALQPFYGKINNLSAYIREAKSKCYYPAKPKLTRDESAAIYIYTMKWGDGCLYDHLQAAWESNKASELKPWFKYLKLFKTAFDKLPDAKGEIWKGKSYDERLREELKSKSTSLYVAMDLFSPSQEAVEEMLDDRGVEQKIFLGFKSVCGKLVGDYAAFKENGVLVWPGTKLGVSDIVLVDGRGSVTFHLIGPPPPETPKKSPILEKHFVCYNKNCDHRCSRNHDSNHCHGFDAISHLCGHHCGPTHICIQCLTGAENVYQCKKCESRYCKTCFDKYAMIF